MFLHSEFGPHGEGTQGFITTGCSGCGAGAKMKEKFGTRIS